MEPSCQPREAKKENDVAVLYACLGVFVAVIIVVAILLYLKWKSKSKCKKGILYMWYVLRWNPNNESNKRLYNNLKL